MKTRVKPIIYRAISSFVISLLACVMLSSSLSAAPLLYANVGGQFVAFRADAPGTYTRAFSAVGIAAELRAMDFRLTTGELFALFSNGSSGGSDFYVVRRINLTTGYVSELGTVGTAGVPTGSRFGMAFDPYLNQIRIVTSAGGHFPLNPETGGSLGFNAALQYVAGDSGALITPVVEHIAFKNAVANPTDTTLYGIDTSRNVLVRIGPADVAGSSTSSNLTTISSVSLGINPENAGGFVIDPGTDVGYFATNALVSSVFVPRLYGINLVTGTATFIGEIGSGSGSRLVRGLALPPEVNPCLDIDGDGVLNANRDGLMYTRILLGLTGTAVTANAISTINPPPRRTWDAIRLHLINDCGMSSLL
jgi:Domain of unknown function (DUF4394)